MKNGIGRVALITGGATGIGRAVGERLVQEGVDRIYVNYAHSRGAAAETVAALQALGAAASAVRADVSDPTAVNEMIAQIESEVGSVDHLVNSAGVTELIPFSDLDAVTPDVWDRLWRINVLGTFQVTRAATPLLRRARGSVVNVASIAAHRAVGSSVPYGATKAAVLQVTRAMAVALAPDVRVNAVSPGTVRTGWHDRLVGADEFQSRAEAEASTVPLGRLADASDIADVIVGLLRMTFVTGQDIVADGGKSLRY